ncbi:MAG: MerR family transcriptional regulator [Saprospiraceae bacterium]|nr:MerR family transcriptional regulator [Saprospiraceae bacterium]
MDQIIRRYYSIREVCDMFGLNTSVLRHWEKEFKQLSPSKLSGGERRYTASDIDMVRQIHHLLKERGFTIDGARKELASKGTLFADEAKDQQKEIKEKLLDIKERLLAIRNRLDEESPSN